MRSIFGFALVCMLVLAMAGCSLPGMPAPTPSLPALPPIASKAPPINTLPPLPTFTKSASTPQVITTTPLSTLPAPTTQPAAALATATKPAVVQPTATKPAATATTAAATATTATTATTAAATQPPATKIPATATAVLSAREAKIFMIAINDNGVSGKKIGCNDSVVPVTITLADPAAPLRGALDKLMAVRTQFYGQSGLYNSLFRSDLRIDSVTINNSLAEIKLSGSLTLGGTCDSPRVLAQFEETALQFSTVKSVNILINGKKLQDLLSSK